ncbi:unnamed protein product, partial [Effrenium voratum]
FSVAALGYLAALWAGLESMQTQLANFQRLVPQYPYYWEKLPKYPQSEMYQKALGQHSLPAEYYFFPTDFVLPDWYRGIDGMPNRWNESELARLHWDALGAFSGSAWRAAPEAEGSWLMAAFSTGRLGGGGHVVPAVSMVICFVLLATGLAQISKKRRPELADPEVQKVKQHQEDMSKEVYDLSRTTSALQKREACQSQDEKENESDKLRAELTAVEEARKKARNFGEDLLEDMMALDDLSGLSEEDRSTRKAALAGLEGLLQDVDTAKSRLAMLHRQLEGKLKKADEKKQAEERARKAEEEKRAQEAAAEKAAAEAAAPPEAPEEALASARRRAKEGKEAAASALEPPAPGKEVWQQVRLPLRFHSREEPSNYVISATVPGLDLDDLKLELVDSSTTLRVEGLRLPSSKEAATMRKRIAAKIRQVAQRSPEKFAMMVKALPQVAADAYLELGQGEYGRFAETFQLPSDVDVENIEASYTDGVLRIVLPKVQRPSATAFNPRARGPAPAPRRPMHPGL